MTEIQPTLNGLAAKITELSETFTKLLQENNIPEPTFAADSPPSYVGLTAESFLIRQKLLDAVNDMWYLTQGPSESIFNYVHTAMPDAAALNTMNYFDFWSAVPVNGTASYADIAEHTSLPEDVVYRLLQHAMTLRIFSETEPGKPSSRVQHTSRSAALARSSGLRALVSTVLDDSGAPMMVMNEALAKYSRGKPALTQEMNETSFALFHRSGIYGKYSNPWEFLENDGEGEKKGWRAANFAEFMRYVKEIFRLEEVVLQCHDWKAAGKATVVDLGGSAGHDAVVLARNFPDLKIIVQDLPKVKPVFDTEFPSEFKPRVSFVEHDFFQPQPVQADIYIIKMILHDWPDQEAAKILRALVPALKPGARVLLIEYIGKHDKTEGPALPRSIQQMGTATDVRMMALFNTKERAVDGWKDIFRAADERFDVVRVNASSETFFAVVEAVWRG
ncbi:sterigmatocystin 8-O-methyltransferase [Blastomyces gilchristii SLH14081]|uniref:Sterigmatocystin 8-O-methyltransferase n=1 Tax=Blastomyces gilchristii (strain SLH14081) TaxID=559298 RepID=A0A179UU79_BLAGS|nr:sterigmatocystin 8-O-methyltransferase [Blastomyces gilchristii SLH14081]OAT11676.1 sterigmatocystin 8-O-methyltransferase [Blastomyces gilchristii SLH14081]